MSIIFERVSIRKYLVTPVEPEKIESLLRAAMAAPSAQNQQPWEYYVVKDRELLQKLSTVSEYAGFVKNAAVAFVACYRKDTIRPLFQHIDMAASVQNLLLRATELDLGAVWIGVAPREERMEAVETILEIPDHLHAFAIISCGYPVEKRQPQDRYDATRVHYR